MCIGRLNMVETIFSLSVKNVFFFNSRLLLGRNQSTRLASLLKLNFIMGKLKVTATFLTLFTLNRCLRLVVHVHAYEQYSYARVAPPRHEYQYSNEPYYDYEPSYNYNAPQTYYYGGQPAKPFANQYYAQPTANSNPMLEPKLMGFSKYKSMFRKKYSKLETSMRKMLFLGRQMLAYLSQLRYRKHMSPTYLGINQMSDYTPEEISKTMSKPDELMGHEEGAFRHHSDSPPAGYPTRHKRETRAQSGGSARKERPRMFRRKSKSKHINNYQPNVVYIDHRQALVEPKDQGKCRSSYAFASEFFSALIKLD